jgi:hypothetical protein
MGFGSSGGEGLLACWQVVELLGQRSLREVSLVSQLGRAARLAFPSRLNPGQFRAGLQRRGWLG